MNRSCGKQDEESLILQSIPLTVGFQSYTDLNQSKPKIKKSNVHIYLRQAATTQLGRQKHIDY